MTTHRIIDVPIESLPFVDEHYVEIAATPEQVWEALIRILDGISDGRSGASISRALGCAQTEVEGEVGEIGSTIPGFVVTRAIRPAVLALMGQHRFSEYALIFSILEKPSGLVLLGAQTRARVPRPPRPPLPRPRDRHPRPRAGHLEHPARRQATRRAGPRPAANR